jgi:hypothetical protein
MYPDLHLKRHLIDQIPLNIWAVNFASKVTLVPEQLHIGTSSRLVKKEGPLCVLCGEGGHNSWSCSGYKGVRLSPILGSRTGVVKLPVKPECREPRVKSKCRDEDDFLKGNVRGNL